MFGTVLSPQPQATIIGFNGLPIVGKTCIVMGGVEPTYGDVYGSDAMIDGNKYFTFNNPYSLPSD